MAETKKKTSSTKSSTTAKAKKMCAFQFRHDVL